MADIEPLRALHYDTAVAGELGAVTAPPYDVIDAQQRQQLLARSPHNVVAIDLPQGGDDPYARAGELFATWQREGVLVRDSQPALWAHSQAYTGPDGRRRERRGFFCRVRLQEYGAGRVRPHERTHPGPKQDRLALMRATDANLSPIFALHSDPSGGAWAALEPATRAAPWGECTDADDTVHRLWRVTDADAIAAVQRATRDAELLIADGHHRYETARAYAQERGDEDGGDRGYVLACLVALEDPGLTVFPTHRLVRGLDAEQRDALTALLREDFEIEEVPRDLIVPPPAAHGRLQIGYVDALSGRALRMTLRSQAIADDALPGHSDAYRRLDTAVLEALILKGVLGRSDDDISHLRDFGYARDAEQALALVQAGEYEAAFLMAPTPVAQVAEVAAAGESMPPKSTYFFPKLLTGLLFNPLS